MPRRSKENKPNTLRAVAAAAGVSEMTVSRVLRGEKNVAEATRQRVERSAARLGYVHNRLASSLASSRNDLIGVVIPSLRNIVFPEVLAGISDKLESTGYQAVVAVTEYDLEREEQLVRSILSWRPAAMIIANADHHEGTRTALRRADVPIVETMELSENPIDMNVGIDHRLAGATMARHLIARGYRRFAYLGTDHAFDYPAGRRYQGFVGELKRAGAKMLLTISAAEASSIKLGRKHMATLLARYDDFDAVYFSNDAVAAGAMMYCLEQSVRIPEDIAMGGFGGLEIAECMPIPITTVRSPRYDMGKIAAQLVLDRFSGAIGDQRVVADADLIPGRSA